MIVKRAFVPTQNDLFFILFLESLEEKETTLIVLSRTSETETFINIKISKAKQTTLFGNIATILNSNSLKILTELLHLLVRKQFTWHYI